MFIAYFFHSSRTNYHDELLIRVQQSIYLVSHKTYIWNVIYLLHKLLGKYVFFVYNRIP